MINYRSRFADHAITFFPTNHLVTYLDDMPTKFMTEYDRIIYMPAMI